MAFVSFSSQLVIDNTTAVSNVFFEEHLPQCIAANPHLASVYLYGLYLCGSASRYDNTLEHFSNNLGLSQEDIESAFIYLQELGLVQILSAKPIQIKYLPVRQNAARIKKYEGTKYADFNAQIQAMIEGRQITPNEFLEYYAFLESFHVEPAALVMIAKHCVNLKGANVGYSYILTVAKNWAYSGVKTVEAVEEKLQSEQSNSAGLAKVLKILALKRTAEPGDHELYRKWKQMGYSQEVIELVAKQARGSVNKLDTLLLKYFELKLFEKKEIEEYSARAKDLTSLAFAINKKIGVYYENVETIVQEYLVPWQLRGFDGDTLLAVAGFCFKSGKRTLADMDSVVNRFYKLGLTTPAAIDGFISEKVAEDKVVKKLLDKLGLAREVNPIDRDFYTTWTAVWNFAPDIIDYAASLAVGKTSPMAYMNKILAAWREQKIVTLEQAKSSPPLWRGGAAGDGVVITRHSYSDAELKSLFSNIDEVKF